VTTVLATSPIRARIDRGQVEQVILNLAVNARDAMPRGGKLEIRTGAFLEPGETLGVVARFARITVADTGTGMSPEIRAKIFEPFFTTKGPGQGTGLGLATVYGIVTQAGGRISVDTSLGVGTSFHVDLPWTDSPLGSSTSIVLPATKQNGEVGVGRSILLVEDEESVRKLARLALEGAGYAVTDAPDGETALEIVASGVAIDLLVTDMTMPGIGGRELALQVRANRPEIGVVFISGYAADIGQLDLIPQVVFLPKPFSPADLARAAGKAIIRAERAALANT